MVQRQSFKNPLPPVYRILQAALTRLRPAELAVAVKRGLCLRRVVIETPFGKYWIDPISNLGVELCRTGEYEAGLRRKIQQSLRPSATFLDIGANEGYFTVIGARCVRPGGRVVAIEPQRRLLPVIQENLRLNKLCEGIEIVNVAVADKDQEMELYLAPGTNTGASGLHAGRALANQQRVAAKTLVSIFDEHDLQFVDFAKIDIEGGEYEAIISSPEIFLTRRIGLLALELHPRQLAARGKNAQDIIEMLAATGYRMFEHEGHTMWSPEKEIGQ